MVDARWTLSLVCLVGLNACGSYASSGSSGSSGATGGAGAASAAGTGGTAGAGGAPTGDPLACARAASGIAIGAGVDAVGYARHALSGCTLAYQAEAGGLRLRDLATGDEVELDPSENQPSRPTLAADVVAWEAISEGRSVIRVHAGGSTRTLEGSFHHAGEPRAADGVVVFTAWHEEDPTSDTDVLRYDVGTSSVAVVLEGSGQQRFADVSADYFAASDFAEDPGGHYLERGSLSDIVVVARETGAVTRRSRPDKQAFPMLGSNGMLGYLEWKGVHPEPKFEGFELFVGAIDASPADDVLVRAIDADPRYVRPSAQGELIDFIGLVMLKPVLYRTHFLTPSAVEATPLDDVTETLGLVAQPNLTLLGARTDTTVELRVVEH